VLHLLFDCLRILYRGTNCEGTCHPPSPLYVSRAAALAAGIPDSVPVSTVNRLCSSGLMAIRNIAHSIRAGEISLGVAVGVESMSVKSVSSSRRLVLATHGVALQFDSQSVLIFLVYVVPAPLPW
jgi:acetyl-CoA acetyltransferase